MDLVAAILFSEVCDFLSPEDLNRLLALDIEFIWFTGFEKRYKILKLVGLNRQFFRTGPPFKK